MTGPYQPGGGHAHRGPSGHGNQDGRANHVGDGSGSDKHAGHSVEMFRDKFALTLALTIPTLIWGHMLPGALGYRPPAVPGAKWIPAVFGTVGFLYGGRPFLNGAVRELRDRLPGMMTLISLAITVAAVFSLAVTAGFPGTPLWEELATLVSIICLAIGSRCDPSPARRGRWPSWRSCCRPRPIESRPTSAAKSSSRSL